LYLAHTGKPLSLSESCPQNENVPNFSFLIMAALAPPAGTIATTRAPKSIKLNKEPMRASPIPSYAHCRMGATVLADSRADFGRLIAEGNREKGKVVKFVGTKPDL
jgi:hypothetical protein